jgi:hypothetical protein
MEDAMTCEAYRQIASAWFDGEEEGDAFPQLLRHVAECGRCSEFMGSLPRQTRLVGQLRGDNEETVPGSADAGEPQETYGFFTARIRAPLAAAAAIILVLITLAVERSLSTHEREATAGWRVETALEPAGGQR